MRAKKIDTTHRAIADHLRSVGWSVSSTAAIGRGFPDLLVALPGFTALVECKTPGGKLNAAQRKFHAGWKGVIVTAFTPEEAEEKLMGRFLEDVFA